MGACGTSTGGGMTVVDLEVARWWPVVIVSFGERIPGLKWMIVSATNDVRVWLYVNLTPYPLNHGPRGSIGWVGQGKSGPLNFAPGGMAVTDVFLH